MTYWEKKASAVGCFQTNVVPCHNISRHTHVLQREAPRWPLLMLAGLQPCTLAVPGQTRQLRLLPPPTDRSNPLDIVAVASTAEVSTCLCDILLHNRASQVK